MACNGDYGPTWDRRGYCGGSQRPWRVSAFRCRCCTDSTGRNYLLRVRRMGDHAVQLSSESVRARLKSLNSFRLRRRFRTSFADPPLHSPVSTAPSSPPSLIRSDLRETAGFSRMPSGKNERTSQGWRGEEAATRTLRKASARGEALEVDRVAFVSANAGFAD